MWLLWIALGLLAFGALFVVVKCIIGRSLLKAYKRDSLIVFGKKGKGKTLLFSEMTRMERKGYVSTTDFKHRKQELMQYGDVNVYPNTWESVLEGKIVPISPKNWEGKSVYLDDSGVYLPNFADSMLKKRYESMPIAYAVWRHLYNAPIHINSQDVERCWKMIREQADGFIQVRGCFRIGPFAIVRCTYYDRINSARQGLSPMRGRIFNKFSKAELDQFRAMNGIIKDFWVFAPAWRNRYDSRYFKSVFFNVPTESHDEKTPSC